MIDQDLFVAVDRELWSRFSEYRDMPVAERLRLVDYVYRVEVPRYPQYLGSLSAAAVTAIIGIISLIVTAVGTIVPLAIQSRQSREAGRVQASTGALVAEAATIEAQAEAARQAVKKKELGTKIVLASVIGAAVIAAVVTLT